jgi:putative oxidoreductase
MADLTAHHPPYARWAHVLLRVIASAAFMQHGAQKLFGVLGGTAQAMGTLPWFAGVLEFFGGALVLIGLFTRPVAFILAGEMAVAYFMAHFPQGFWPVQNYGEPAVLFCFIFLYFAATGAGAISLDYIRLRRNRSDDSLTRDM